ncbi:DUF262 domain-containing protein [Kineosporia babensis]|uniref:DUF262 domain-containing HNH endonuclease family protein n=1 Tax=Kineosporia babensis TaxID=499548 RepID=A0A9X1NDJ4_9ACTN|nr:DUF262 domain-containing protein [Kineosporia babensis]MCD5312997.1 DUF262 domain-containing HNH endonuclease family protein [Kineosporia babensis]
MQAQTHSPTGIFGNQIRYVVPLFQRPYVWSEGEQWAPLWEDVCSVADAVLQAPAPMGYGGPTVAPHFLGAIVLEQQATLAGYIAVRHVIDGQQRLTTLQILLDAVQEVVEAHGRSVDAQALHSMVTNNPAVTQAPEETFKVWPTSRDQQVFRLVMDNDQQVPPELAENAIAQAHRFFRTKTLEWSGVATEPEQAAERLGALAQTLAHHLRMVVIDLEPGDNAQVIFETLNHRGTPLLAADLIKNYLFQVATAQNADLEKLYAQFWAQFDNEYWRAPVAQGRLYRPRIDVFLNYWLTVKLLKEVATDRIFVEFRDLVRREQSPVAEIMNELAEAASIYESLDKLPESSVPARFHYRVVKALDSAAVTPFLLWLLRWNQDALRISERDRALNAVESWIVRRTLCRLTNQGVNRVVVELLRTLVRSGSPSNAGALTEEFLGAQTADSRLWPDDEWFIRSLSEEPLYKMLTRGRLRMIIEALEDDVRSEKSEAGRCPRNLTVEHVMPQEWKAHWDDGRDLIEAAQRDQLVQTLGNLTLLTGKLNSSVSNGPWTMVDASGNVLEDVGKRAALLRHSTLKLNAYLIVDHPKKWTDDDIRSRGLDMATRATEIWSRPGGLEQNAPLVSPRIVTLAGADAGGEPVPSPVVQHTGRYRALWDWLQRQHLDLVTVSFEDVEEVLNFKLPASARNYPAFWIGREGGGIRGAIADAGWRAAGVNVVDEHVTFVRGQADF